MALHDGISSASVVRFSNEDFVYDDDSDHMCETEVILSEVRNSDFSLFLWPGGEVGMTMCACCYFDFPRFFLCASSSKVTKTTHISLSLSLPSNERRCWHGFCGDSPILFKQSVC
jgi:hypothetical protein